MFVELMEFVTVSLRISVLPVNLRTAHLPVTAIIRVTLKMETVVVLLAIEEIVAS